MVKRGLPLCFRGIFSRWKIYVGRWECVHKEGNELVGGGGGGTC